MVFIADGCSSNFRKRCLDNSKASVCSRFVGYVNAKLMQNRLKLYGCKLPFPNHGMVILSENSPILVYQISSNCEKGSVVRVLVDIKNPKLNISDIRVEQSLFTVIEIPV